VPRENLRGLVREVSAQLPEKNAATIIALMGELGAGKTAFVQEFAKELGISQAVQSPTYVLMKKYQVSNSKFQTLVHVDAYRLQNSREFAALKPEEFLSDPLALVFVEWPERVTGALPAPDLVIKFSSEGADEKERFVEIEK